MYFFKIPKIENLNANHCFYPQQIGLYIINSALKMGCIVRIIY